LSQPPYLRDLLSRRDPHGYYVIPVKPEGREVVERIARRRHGEIVVVDAVDVILVKVRSKSLASKILRILNQKGLIAVGGQRDEDYVYDEPGYEYDY